MYASMGVPTRRCMCPSVHVPVSACLVLSDTRRVPGRARQARLQFFLRCGKREATRGQQQWPRQGGRELVDASRTRLADGRVRVMQLYC